MLSLHCWAEFSSCHEQGLLSSCGAWASHCSGFSCCGAVTLGLMGSVAASPGLKSTDSVVVVLPGLSCSEARASSQVRDRTCISCIGSRES